MRRILERDRAKTSRRHLFVDFPKAFDSIRREMEQILLAYGLPKETVIAIMMLYSNTKVKVHSPYGDTDIFDIVTGDTLASYLFIIWLRTSNVYRSNKRKWLYTRKGKKQTISRRNYYRRRLCRWHCAFCKCTKSNPRCIAWSRHQEALGST